MKDPKTSKRFKPGHLYNKKGVAAAGSIGTIIALVVMVGTAVLMIIFLGSLGGQTYELVEPDLDSIGNTVVTGETHTVFNYTRTVLDHGSIHNGTLTAVNGTGAGALRFNLSNFTIDYTNGYLEPINFPNSTGFGGGSMQFNYTWGEITNQHLIKSSIVKSFGALETSTDYLPLAVLAVIIVAILGLVLGLGAVTGFNKGGSAL